MLCFCASVATQYNGACNDVVPADQSIADADFVFDPRLVCQARVLRLPSTLSALWVAAIEAERHTLHTLASAFRNGDKSACVHHISHVFFGKCDIL